MPFDVINNSEDLFLGTKCYVFASTHAKDVRKRSVVLLRNLCCFMLAEKKRNGEKVILKREIMFTKEICFMSINLPPQRESLQVSNENSTGRKIDKLISEIENVFRCWEKWESKKGNFQQSKHQQKSSDFEESFRPFLFASLSFFNIVLIIWKIFVIARHFSPSRTM